MRLFLLPLFCVFGSCFAYLDVQTFEKECAVPVLYRVPCGGATTTRQQCENQGCCYDKTVNNQKICFKKNIDECEENTHNCDRHAFCVDYPYSFVCLCKAGFKGNGVVCQDIDECENPLLHTCESPSICLNEPGGYSCV